MKIDKYLRTLLLTLIVLYFSQNILYSGGGSIIAQSSLFLILTISGFYWIKTILDRGKKNMFYYAWTTFLLLNIIGYIFTSNYLNNLHFSQLKTILMVLLPFFPFYYFAQHDELKAKHLTWFFIAMMPIIIAQFYFEKTEILLMNHADNANVINNVAYTFVFLIPYLFILKNKKFVSLIFAFIILLFIIQGAKRGAMIIGSIGILFFAYYQLKTIEKKNRLKGVFLVIIGVFVLAYLGYNYYQQNEFLIYRMQLMSEGEFSGRDIIYTNLFNTWYHSDNLLNILFGHGFASTLQLSGTGNFAHNDWLELLTDFGLIGVIIYGLIFFAVIRLVLNTHWNNDKRILLFTIIIIWFSTSLVSMNYITTDSMFQSIILAYLIGSPNESIV